MPLSPTIKQIEGKPGQVYRPLQLNEVPKPVPGPGEVLVKIHAAALNHRGFFVRQHLYPGISFTSPLLCDGCGTIVEVGPDCTVAASTMLNKLVILLPCLGWDSKFDGPEDMAKYAIIGEGPWSERDRLLLRIVDEQLATFTDETATMEAALEVLSNEELVEILIIIGAYSMLARIIRGLKVDDDQTIISTR
ncbi:Zinc-type alcohol dehydrogenase-like protein YogA [Microsporum canis]